MAKGERATKTGEPRNILISLKFSKSEFDLLTTLCNNRKKVQSRKWSRVDVIVDSLNYAYGQVIF